MKATYLLTYLVGAMLLLASACAGTQGTYAEAGAPLPAYESTEAMADGEEYAALAEPRRGEKLVRSYGMTLVTKDRLDSVGARLVRLTEAMGGYPESTTDTYFRLRLPQGSASAFLDAAAALGRVDSRTTATEDLTARYTDVAARIRSLEALRDRYLVLLERGETVEDLLAVERELARVTLELDQLKSARAGIDERVAYSAVVLTLREKVKPGPIGLVFEGLYRGVKWLFVRG